MKKKKLNIDELNSTFNLENDNVPLYSNINENESTELILDDKEKEGEEGTFEDIKVETDLIENINDLLTDVKDIISIAKYVIESAPDPDTLQSAAQLFTSASNLLKELNKGVVEQKKQQWLMKLEKLKIQGRKEAIKLRSDLSGPLGAIGNNNSINITQNNLVQFSQEDIVKQIRQQEKEEKQNLIEGEAD